MTDEKVEDFRFNWILLQNQMRNTYCWVLFSINTRGKTKQNSNQSLMLTKFLPNHSSLSQLNKVLFPLQTDPLETHQKNQSYSLFLQFRNHMIKNWAHAIKLLLGFAFTGLEKPKAHIFPTLFPKEWQGGAGGSPHPTVTSNSCSTAAQTEPHKISHVHSAVLTNVLNFQQFQ